MTASGAAVGGLMGAFGVGGSSVATPLLSLAGVPPLIAVASPLPAAIPGALLAARPYLRSGDARPKAAGWSLLGAMPATVVGALLSRAVGGTALLIASGIVLIAVGVRVLLPIEDAARVAGTLAAAAAADPRARMQRGCGLFTGLLANGGGFPADAPVPAGLRPPDAPGGRDGLLVIAVLSVPTLLTHAALGHVDWEVSAQFAAGLLPASLLGGRWSERFASGIPAARIRLVPDRLRGDFTAYRLIPAG